MNNNNITSKSIIELCNNNIITIIKKNQKTRSNYNYFISPNLSIPLYNSKVLISTQDYIVLEFDKINNFNLYLMLKTIDKYIINYLKECFTIDEKITIYSLYSDTETHFTIRCSLPNYNYKYSIKYYNSENNQIPFKLPKKDSIIPKLSFDIRNLWHSNNRIGYNLQLKLLSDNS